MSDRAALERAICALLADPAAPYAYTLDAAPGDTYESPGPPWYPLRVVESEATPIEQVLYHRQTIAVDAAPGEPPALLSVHRMVGRLADGREVPLGEPWAVPAAVIRAAGAPGDGRCGACGLVIHGVSVVDAAGRAYHRGCMEDADDDQG
jgi:hypothetical protein